MERSGLSMEKADYVFEWYKDHHDTMSNDVIGCFADDTGLCIRALDWKPGVITARWAGEACNPADNRAKTLKLMKGISDRYAEFRTVVTLILWGEPQSIDTPLKQQFVGTVEGNISEEEWGEKGFGYDPIFIPEGHELTFAQLPTEYKNSISHRARAMKKLADFLGK